MYDSITKHKQTDWLVFYGTSTQDRSICANLPGGLLAQAFEDSQWTDNIQKHTVACDTMNIHMQRQTTGTLYLLKDKHKQT